MNYIEQYYNAINTKKIIANKDVTAEVSRVYYLFKTNYIEYNEELPNKYIDYIQGHLKYSNYSGENFNLTLFQKFIIACAYGVYRDFEVTKIDPETGLKVKKIEKQLFFKKFIIQMGKKSGKTELIAALGFIELRRRENKHQSYYLMSENQEQARVLFDALVNIINQSPVKKRFKINKKPAMILDLDTGNALRIVVGDGVKLQGTKIKTAIVDEFHAIKKSVEPSISLSTKSVSDSKEFYISTAGLISNGMYDELLAKVKRWKEEGEEAKKENEPPSNRNLSLIYKLDNPAELSDRKAWEKALPNIGITYSQEDLLDEVKEAQYDAATKRELLAYIFGLPQSASIAFFDKHHAQRRELDPKIMTDHYCVIGADLALSEDFASASIVVYKHGKYHVHVITVKPRKTSKTLAAYKVEQYDKFVMREELYLSESDEIDTMELAKYVHQYIEENELIVTAIAYDRIYSTDFLRYLKERHHTETYAIAQGAMTMAAPFKELAKELAKGNVIHDNSLFEDSILSVVTRSDANGNLIPSKKNSGGNKIDPFAGFFNAYIAITTILMDKYPDLFPREEV